MQVVLVAIKSDLLEGINAAVEAAGLRPRVIGVANMGLYNAFRYNYSDVTDASLVVDIGARTTNLLFIEPGKIFSRSVPIGGSSITTALAREFNEPFAAAETRKRESGFVSLGGDSSGPPSWDFGRSPKRIRRARTCLRAVASCPMELSLRPGSVIRAHEVERRRSFLIGAATCVIAALLGWSVFYMHAAGVLSAVKEQVDAKVATLRGFQTRIDGVRKEA